MNIYKTLFVWLILGIFNYVNAEGVVVLDGESGMTETKSEASDTVEVTTTSNDGKLILNENSKLGGDVSVTLPASSEPVNQQQSVTDEKVEVFTPNPSPVLIDSMEKRRFGFDNYIPSYVQVYSGRLNTSLNKTSSSLTKGIDVFGFGIANAINNKWQAVMAIEIGQSKNEKNASKNIVIYQVKLGAEYGQELFVTQKIKLLILGSVTFGDFNLRSVANENISSVTLNKYGEGALVGLHPGLGVRFPVGNFFHLDTMALRPMYLGNKRKNLGGFEYLLRFAIPW